MRVGAGPGGSPLGGTFSFIAGFVCGWAVRSTVDSPQALSVKVLGIALQAKNKVNRWLAVERERMTDILAEARAMHDLPGAELQNQPAAPEELLSTARTEEP